MTAELNAKKDAKWDETQAEEAKVWMEAVTGETLKGDASSGNLVEVLKDGAFLCKVINVLQPGSVRKVNASKMAFKQMENIGNFLAGCEAYGVPRTDMFQTVDLYEGQNMPQVINGIFALGRKARAKGFDGPTIGPKEATGQKRDFTQEQLQAGKGVIGLQMGTNKGASQAGSTPYGLGRQIEKTNLKN